MFVDVCADLNRVEHVGASVAAVPAAAGGKVETVTRPPPPATVRLDAASRELRHAAQGVEALGALVHYLVHTVSTISLRVVVSTSNEYSNYKTNRRARNHYK